jgi:hypothetical protein
VRRPGLETPKSASSPALGCLVRAQSCDHASGTECNGHWVYLTEEDSSVADAELRVLMSVLRTGVVASWM